MWFRKGSLSVLVEAGGEGRREGGKEGGREGRREGRREGGRGGREGGREQLHTILSGHPIQAFLSSVQINPLLHTTLEIFSCIANSFPS